MRPTLTPGSEAALPEAPSPSQTLFLGETRELQDSSRQGNWGVPSHEVAQVIWSPNPTFEGVWDPWGELGTFPQRHCGLRLELGRCPSPPGALCLPEQAGLLLCAPHPPGHRQAPHLLNPGAMVCSSPPTPRGQGAGAPREV